MVPKCLDNQGLTVLFISVDVQGPFPTQLTQKGKPRWMATILLECSKEWNLSGMKPQLMEMSIQYSRLIYSLFFMLLNL